MGGVGGVYRGRRRECAARSRTIRAQRQLVWVLKFDSLNGLWLETCGREWERSTPRSARSWVTVFELIDEPRSACRVSWGCRSTSSSWRRWRSSWTDDRPVRVQVDEGPNRLGVLGHQANKSEEGPGEGLKAPAGAPIRGLAPLSSERRYETAHRRCHIEVKQATTHIRVGLPNRQERNGGHAVRVAVTKSRRSPACCANGG